MSHSGTPDELDPSSRESHRLSVLSHELKTPLAIISGYAEVLQEELGSKHIELIAPIREASARLGLVIEALVSLEASALPSLRKVSQTKEFSPVDIVKSTLLETYENARAARVTFSMKLEGSHWIAQSCPDSFKSALKPLVENAIKFAGPGLVEVVVHGGQEDISVQVIDKGPGPGNEADQLFEPFVQGSCGLNRQHDGLGLGLTLARRSAERINGSLQIAARPTGGTVAHLTIPRRLKESRTLAA